MALEAYRKKRDFKKTPEPKGAPARKARGPLSFVIQKHAASHLHYDFRLELDGVLKSWAVPKGPSLDPAVHRLAVHVEDHPLEYGDFEGVIPKGEYGGGTVALWDRGKWIPQDDPAKAYKAGKLKFVLEGEKLHGGWVLVRSKRAEEGQKEQWLLMKEKDAFARPGSGDAVVEENPRSVTSGRTIPEIAAAGDRVWHSGVEGGGPAAAAVVDPSNPKGARRAPLPETLEPELATLVETAPGGDDWLHEIKFDGYRAVARISGGTARLLTRRGQDWTDRFSSIARELEKLPVQDAVLDGEVVVVTANGTTSFQALQEAIGKGRQEDMVYYLFDLIHLNGYDLRKVALEERKAMLSRLLPFSSAGQLRASEHVFGNGDVFHQEACRLGLEGILSKRLGSPYRSGRGRDWLKVKCQLEQEFVIGGWTDPSGSRVGFGALLLGVYEGKSLRYVGKVGTGFNDALLRSLRRTMGKLKAEAAPFMDPPREKGVHWLEPSLVAEVAFTEWTKDGAVRHPTFRGLREDKAATAVIRERPRGGGKAAADASDPTAGAAMKARAGRPAAVDGGETTAGSANSRVAGASARSSEPSGLERARAWAEGEAPPSRRATRPKGPKETRLDGVRLSHPERVLFPAEGVTKLDLARYYVAVGDLMVPLVAERPLMLVRCPEGIAQQCFFQKHANDQVPASVSRVRVPEKDGTGEYMYVSSLEGVLALLNLGALELHTWGCRADKVERPDRVVFDLDPDPTVSWDAVVELALHMKEGLEELGLESFAKTTGGKGLHIVVPLARRNGWEEMTGFARAFAQRIADQAPTRYTLNMSKAKRKGRIFIDYLRNARGATAVEAYSVRARPGAPVSTPVRWEEVGPKLRPDQWTALSFDKRLKALKGKDPWKGYGETKQALSARVLRAVGVK